MRFLPRFRAGILRLPAVDLGVAAAPPAVAQAGQTPGLVGTAHVADELTGPEEALCWVVGVGVTGVLFLGLAHLENVRAQPPAAEIMDVRAVSIPVEPPPPTPSTAEPLPPRPENTVALAGLDAGPSDSAVHIAVVPPDLEELVPATREPPGVIARFGYLNTDLKPRLDVQADVDHVYQLTEVDQRPRAVVRVAPKLWAAAYNWGPTLSVTLLLRIDRDGRVEIANVLQSSGHGEFDTAVVETVTDKWLFSPAIRHSRKVRCLVEQKVTIVLASRSPFGVH